MIVPKSDNTSLLPRAWLVVPALLVLIASAILFNTWRHSSKQMAVAAAVVLPIDEAAAAERLAAALRFQTVSDEANPDRNADEFRQLHAYLGKVYPHAHAALKRELVGNYSLLYTWEGSDSKARPIMLMAHQDVVPIAPDTEGDWTARPFAGEVKNGFIWGRGAWDDKGNLMSIMEAVDRLAATGFRPSKTIYLAFGHDEEVTGQRGGKAIAGLLQQRGVRLEYILDEGLVITQGVMKGLEQPVALIGTAEKGYASIHLNATVRPGHSSMPPRETAIGMLSAAVAGIEDRQFPADLRGVARETLETLAPEMSGINRVLLSNLWLFKPLVQYELEKTASSNAMLRTTTAPTLFHAGNKENVLPGVAEATVNFRILSGDTTADVMHHVRQSVHSEQIALTKAAGSSEPSRISATDTRAYETIHRTIREVFPGTVVAPGLMVAATDSRHFQALADSIYRFSPVRAAPDDLARFHGTNERISIQNYAEMIRFYHRLLSNSAMPATQAP